MTSRHIDCKGGLVAEFVRKQRDAALYLITHSPAAVPDLIESFGRKIES
jgi:hypothetical protein